MEPQQINPQNSVPSPQPMGQAPMPEVNAMPPKKGKGWMIVAILAILLLLVVGAYSFVAMQSYNSKTSSLNSQISDLENQVKTLTEAATTAGLFKITELSIQFAKPADAKDAYAFVSKNASGEQVASFTSPALQVLAATTPSTPPVTNACGLNSAPLGTVTQVKAGTLIKGVKVEDVKNTDLLIIKKQDVNFYVYTAPTAQCSSVKAVQELQTKQAKALQETFNTNLAALVQ